tara:strand:+ start:2702 stop:3124 length:423 start_codon:yes stop_codon:yes gene_type:complete
MVGNHKSGRKPNPEGSLERSKKYTFYVKEYATTNSSGNIIGWTEDPYFQWFKRHHGSNWQKMVRAYMRWDVERWKKKSWWRCKCEPIGILQNWKHVQQRKCLACGSYYRNADRIADMTILEKQEYYDGIREQMKKDKDVR